MSKIKKVLYIVLLISIVIILIYLSIMWLIYEGVIPEEKFWEYFRKWGIVIILGVIGAIIVSYIVINKIIDKKKDKKDGNEIPKEYVNTHPAIIEAWLPEFIKHTEIPAYIDYSENKEGKIKTKYVDIPNTKKFSDPETGAPHIEIEVIAKAGKRKGVNFVVIRLDEGLEKIKSNWNSYFQSHTTQEMNKYNRRYTPLTKTQDENMRLQILLQQERAEGTSQKDLDILERLKLKSQPVPTELSEEELEKLEKKKELEDKLQQKPKK